MAYKVHIVPSLIVFSLLFIPNLSFPQYDEINFKHLSVEDGLSNGKVHAILQDSRGFMWFGTSYGLNRWDGCEIKIFNHNPQDSSTISHDAIYTLYEDKRGVMWVGTIYGLNKFNRERENFTRYVISDDSIDNTFQNIILQIVEDYSGALWIATAYGLCRLDAATGKVKRFIPKPEYTKPLFSDNYVNSVLEIEKDRFLLGTRNGLSCFSPGTGEFTKLPFNDPAVDSGTSIEKVYKDRVGTLWLGMARLGLIQYNIENGEFDRYILDSEDPSSFSSNSVWTICEDQSGILWIGTYGGGLNNFNRDTKRFTAYKHNSRDAGSICSSSILATYKDKDGNLWIGTVDNGISMISKWGKPVKHYVHDTEDPSSLGYGEVMAICEARSGDLWVAQWGSGISRLINGSRKFIHYVHNPSAQISIGQNRVGCIYEDRSGYIWVGSWGLDRIDPLTNKVIHYQYNSTNPNSLGGYRVFEIYEDREGIMWFGTYDGGLDRFDRNSGTFKHYKHDPLDSMSLSDNFVISIYQDSNDILWVGTVNGLCQMVHLENEEEGFVRYKNDPLYPASLSNNYINYIFEDSNKRLWIGTEQGLNLFNRKENSFTSFTVSDGLPNNDVYSILEDDHKNLWLRTDGGLVKFNPETMVFKSYDERDGLKYFRSIGSGYKAFQKGRTGKFYYGGMNSVSVFHPDSLKDNPNPPRIVLTDFKLNNKPVEIGDNSYLKKTITETKTIELPSYENILSFEFSALDYTSPAKNQYAYKMEGVDRDWVYTDAARRYVSYTNLDPGEYVFTVKGSNCDGVWNEEGVSISIIINPPLWATWWAYILYVMFFVSLFTWVTRFYLNRQRLKHQLELEHEHYEKLEEIDKMKSRFFANISHEFRTPLTLILGPSEGILKDTTEESIVKKAGLIKRNASRLLNLVNQLLDLSKLEAGKLEFRASKGNIVSFIKGITMSFESVAEGKDIALKVKSSNDEIEIYFDKEKMTKILTNLLSNAFKFSQDGGQITVDIKPPSLLPLAKGELKEGSVEIKIRDTGAGIAEEELPKLFDRFYQVDSSQTREHEGTGIGLALTKELVELHHGTISVDSKFGEWTEFTIGLPVGRQHLNDEEIVETEKELTNDIIVNNEEFIPSTVEEVDINEIIDEDKNILLVVEDNADVREYIKDSLGEEFQIEEASNGEQGVRKAENIIPDLIISDIMMPKMDGNELTRILKNDERTSHIPIILLTAKSEQESKLEGLEAGADDYLTKPFDTKELQIRISNLINLRRGLQKKFSKGEYKPKPEEKKISQLDQKFINKLIEVIEQHISDEEYSIEDLGRETIMSRSQIYRKLKALTGKSPSQYIRSIRLAKAKKYIEEQQGNISEIAYSVGFGSPAYFTRCFKAEYGYPPSDLIV